MSVKPAVKHELHACQQQVSLLLDSQREQRSIGMDSETFAARCATGVFYRAQSAVCLLCALLLGYRHRRGQRHEKHRHAEYVMAHLRATEKPRSTTPSPAQRIQIRNRAIGLSADTLRPDRFMSFCRA